MKQRFSLTLLALLLAVILPWWASLILLLFLIFFFPWYYEAVILTLVYELIYGSGHFWLTMAIIIAIPLSEWLKKRLYVFS